MWVTGGGILCSLLLHFWKNDSFKEVSEEEKKGKTTFHTQTFHKYAHRIPTPKQASKKKIFVSIPPPPLLPFHGRPSVQNSLLYTENNFPFPEVHSLWTSFGWTLQSSLKREPFPTVLSESSPFEVTAGLTKLISSIHNMLLMQCWLTLPLAGSCYWTRPKCNV